MYKASSYFGLGGNNCHMQIRCHKTHVVGLSAPVLRGRLGKWMFALSEFDIRYQPAKAVKGQELADLIADRISTDIAALFIRAWAMFFDGSACDDGCGVGIRVTARGHLFFFPLE